MVLSVDNGSLSPLYTIECREAIPRGEVNRLRLRGISRMPNERFEEFADRFVKSIGEPGCDLQKLVDELIELHAVERDEFRSEEHTSELQSLMRTSYAVFCLNNKITIKPYIAQHKTWKTI